MPTGQKRNYILETCSGCKMRLFKRDDSLKNWSGRCKSCNSKEIASRPYIKEIHRKNGLAHIKKYGPPPGPKNENRPRGEKHWCWGKARIGPDSPNWRGGITPENQKIRHSLEYKLWRKAVFIRDNFTCIECGDNRGGNLNADHIKPFSLFPELRFAIDNGRTLCVECHRAIGWSPKKGTTWVAY